MNTNAKTDFFSASEIQKLLEKAVKWSQTRWQTLASAAGVIVVFGLLGIYFISNYTAAKKLSWEKISYAQGYASQGMTAQALQMLDDIISKYPGSDVGQHARFAKADILFKARTYNTSASVYQEIINVNKSINLIPFAYAGLGYSKENMGDYQGAITAYKGFIEKYPNHFLAARIYDSLARVYLISGSAQSAKEMYEKLLTLYPGTYWSAQVQKNFAPPSQNQQQHAPAPRQIPNPK